MNPASRGENLRLSGGKQTDMFVFSLIVHFSCLNLICLSYFFIGRRANSVIVSFTLFFSTPVTINKAIAKLNESIIDGTFGTYKVGALKIVQGPPSSPSATPTTKTTSKHTGI